MKTTPNLPNQIPEIRESQTGQRTHIRQLSYMRFIGLVLVLVYHFYPKLLPGGFIGVDVFFVFSGYLIAALALEEVRVKKAFDIQKFAGRRFLRIFPTVAAAVLVLVPFTLLGNSDLRFQIKEQVSAGLGFISNLYEASTGLSYENSSAPHLFVHLWSLALEVQFYVLIGLVIWVISKYVRKGLRSLLFILSALGAVISAFAMGAGSFGKTDFSVIYYSPLTHLFPFLMGVVLATLAGIKTRSLVKNKERSMSNTRLRLYLGGSILFLVFLAFILHFDNQMTYLFGLLIASLLSCLLIFFLRLLHERSKKQEPIPIRIIAEVSYGVYVFHWPLLIIFQNYGFAHALSAILTLILSFAASAGVVYGLDPILRQKIQLKKRARYIVAGMGVLFTLFALGGVFASSEETSLSRSLWIGSNAQTGQQLALSSTLIQTGAAGAKTLILGDSVTMGARDAATNTLSKVFVDAAGDRKISTDLEASLKGDLSLLPGDATIVIALGTNSVDPNLDISDLQSMISTYSGKHHIVLVTPADWRDGGPFNSDKIADWEVSIKGKFKNVSIADWRAASKNHPEYFDTDGTHIGDKPQGQSVWVKTVGDAIAASN